MNETEGRVSGLNFTSSSVFRSSKCENEQREKYLLRFEHFLLCHPQEKLYSSGNFSNVSLVKY